MKTNKRPKRDGFYMSISPEERAIITKLQKGHAVNICQAFNIFLRQMAERMEKS